MSHTLRRDTFRCFEPKGYQKLVYDMPEGVPPINARISKSGRRVALVPCSTGVVEMVEGERLSPAKYHRLKAAFDAMRDAALNHG